MSAVIAERNGNAIVARGLTKKFGELVAVDHVDLTVARAQVYGFLGPNGSGKTTSIRVLLGLVSADAGTARLFDRPVPDALPEVIGHVGVAGAVDQSDALAAAAEGVDGGRSDGAGAEDDVPCGGHSVTWTGGSAGCGSAVAWWGSCSCSSSPDRAENVTAP